MSHISRYGQQGPATYPLLTPKRVLGQLWDTPTLLKFSIFNCSLTVDSFNYNSNLQGQNET